jgi:hypothetical protein
MRINRSVLAVGLAAIPAILGAVLLITRSAEPSASTTGAAMAEDAVPQPIFTRMLCTLSNEDAKASLVQGADGGMSVVVGDKTWWLFGDTLFLAQSGKQIEQNSIAWSDSRENGGLRPDGCPRLHYYSKDGIAIPFLPKDGSLTVWPAGVWADSDHSFEFYTAYVYGSGPYAYTIGEVGLARLDTDTMQVTVLSRKLWDGDSGFPDQPIGTQPVDLDSDGRLRIILHTHESQKLLARVAPARMADATAYEYWDGAGWTSEPSRAVSLWTPPQASAKNDVEKFAAFENGASIAWNDAQQKYVAIVNVGPDEVGARTADRLEGPWSEPAALLDCRKFAEAWVPTCYSPYQNPALATDGGRRIVVTLTRFRIYDTAAFEITFGRAVHEYRKGDDAIYAFASPGDGWGDEGAAFYASDATLPGFVPVYAWTDAGGRHRYAATSPGDGYTRGDVAFYAAAGASATGSLTPYRPVYDWSDGTTHLLSPKAQGLEQYGYKRGEAAFYAPQG